MDTTNTTFTLHNRSPESCEKAIYAAICHAEDDRFKLPEALLIGIRFGEIEDSMRFIASAGDVYELLEDAGNKLEASLFDAVAVVFCGWGAPIDPTGNVSGLVAPSASPDRVRVRVTLTAGVDGVCSSVRFANKPDGVLFDDGRGALGDAFLDLWAK